MEGISGRDLRIVIAAFSLFARYGVSRTSMAEIAAESGVARQTVYNSFDSKEDLIFAALLHYAGRTRADVERDCADVSGLSGKLEILFRHLAEIPFGAMRGLPHMDEILEVGEGLSGDRAQEIRGIYCSAIRSVLAPHESQLGRHGVALDGLSVLLKGVLTHIKREARDADHLRELFEPVRALIVGCAKGQASRPQ